MATHNPPSIVNQPHDKPCLVPIEDEKDKKRKHNSLVRGPTNKQIHSTQLVDNAQSLNKPAKTPTPHLQDNLVEAGSKNVKCYKPRRLKNADNASIYINPRSLFACKCSHVPNDILAAAI
jgi:hypothetical protein